MLVRRKGNINTTVSVLQYCALLWWCTKIRAVLTGRLTVSGFDLAWFSSLSSKHFLSSVFVVPYILVFFVTFFPFFLLVSWAWWDWPLTWLTNHRPSVLWHCWLGCVTRKIVYEMTYNVSSGSLNLTTPCHTYECHYTLRARNEDDVQHVSVSVIRSTCWCGCI